MWTWLASFLGGPVVNGLINAYKAKLEAANTEGAPSFFGILGLTTRVPCFARRMVR